MPFDPRTFLTERVQAKAAKGVHEVNRLAKELTQSGIRVVRLIQGEPDFDTPAHIKKAGIEALNIKLRAWCWT